MEQDNVKTPAIDYANNLFESIKIINKSLLEGLQFDRTVVCTIIDDSQREKGTYIVTDGSVSFTAYSENTTYRNKNEVYVTIPNGDYDNNKLITGKKMRSDSVEPFIYISPFSTIVDVTGNLITTTDNYGLVANSPSVYYETVVDIVNESNYGSYYIRDDETLIYSQAKKYDENTQYYQKYTDGIGKVIFEKEYANPYYNFTRLGLQASFQAWLQEYNCVAGNYGLKLTIQFVPEQSVSETLNEPTTRIMYLDVADMIGNPYGFETYYNQEKVFDIEGLGGLKYIKLEFFQECGSFYTQEGKILPYLNDFNDEILFSNLFVKDCKVCIGYEVGNYNTEFVQINSFNSKTYTSKVSQVSDNKKEISLKWIHIDEEGNQIQVDKNSAYEYEIRWYRYILGEPSSDNYGGPGWTNPAHERNRIVSMTDEQGKPHYAFEVSEDNFSATLFPDVSLIATEQIKVIILFGAAPGYTLLQSLSDTTYNHNPAQYYIRDTNGKYHNCQNLPYKKGQDYFIQNEDTRRIYRSNIIEFKNENNVINSATLDAIQALTLVCQNESEDGSAAYDTYGNYLLYDQSNRLIDGGQAHVTRLIGCRLNLSATPGDDTETLRNADSIVWRFPLDNTMINCIMDDVIEESEISSDDGQLIPTGYGLVKVKDPGADITSHGMPLFKYTISSIYSPSKSNNIVECTVTKDGVNYHASKELTFGQSGTAGTDWTFAIDLDQSFNAIIPGETGIDYTVTAQLYDNEGNFLDISEKTIEWAFIDPEDTSKDLTGNKIKIDLQQLTAADDSNYQLYKNTRRKLILRNNLNINDLIILKATIVDWGDYELTAFLPIPIRASADYLYLTGATQIIYLTDGNPLYYNKYYEMHGLDKDSGKIIDITNGMRFEPIYGDPTIITKDGGKGLRYMPIVSEQKNKNQVTLGFKLKPVSLYMKELPIFGVQAKEPVRDENGNIVKNEKNEIQYKTIWTQPILIIQNRYPAAMINKWNGQDLVLDETESAIIGKVVGAGKKDDHNRFSGVLMGDWHGKSSANSALDIHTGLFGFHEGALSYSLTEDGCATFGKAETGQIIINGTDSTLKSAGFTLNNDSQTGMEINLSNNTIIAKNQGKDIFKLDGSSSADAYLTINSLPEKNTLAQKTLINISDNNYFLQSKNYVDETVSSTSYSYAYLGTAYSSSTFDRWKKNANDNKLYVKNEAGLYSVATSYTRGQKYYSRSIQVTDTINANGSYFDLNNGELKFNRGIINADVILRPSSGIKYQKYKATSKGSSHLGNSYASWYGVTTDGTGDLQSASLVSVLSDLYSSLEYAKAAADAAGDNASSAQSLASYAIGIAESAQAGVDALKMVNTITSNGYGYLDCYTGTGTGSSGYGVAIVCPGYSDIAATMNGCHMSAPSNMQIWVTRSGVGTSDPDGFGTGDSDIRLKNNITYLNLEEKEKYKELIKDLQFATFNFNRFPNRLSFGLIAQDVEQSLIKTKCDLQLVRIKDVEGQEQTLTLNYGLLSRIGLMLTQDLIKENEQLKSELKELKEIVYEHLGI